MTIRAGGPVWSICRATLGRTYHPSNGHDSPKLAGATVADWHLQWGGGTSLR